MESIFLKIRYIIIKEAFETDTKQRKKSNHCMTNSVMNSVGEVFFPERKMKDRLISFQASQSIQKDIQYSLKRLWILAPKVLTLNFF